jgi:hypothetical protein
MQTGHRFIVFLVIFSKPSGHAVLKRASRFDLKFRFFRSIASEKFLSVSAGKNLQRWLTSVTGFGQKIYQILRKTFFQKIQN